MNEPAPPGRPPYPDERRQQILTELRNSGRIDGSYMAVRLGVTTETVRKDLIQLELGGQLHRVHGGAVAFEHQTYEPHVSQRTEFAAEKDRIARAGLAHLPPAGSVLLDAGSTTSRLADLIPGDRDLTVYTNTLPIALALVGRPRLTVFTLGGRLRPTTLAEVDDWAGRALAEVNVDVLFLGTNGLTPSRGLTTPDPAEAAVKRLMVGAAQRCILLADHSKVGQVRGTRHANLRDIDLLITDTGLDPAGRDLLGDLPVEYA